ncbi:MAG: NAD(P)-dependent glycerol-3-phosphate dehydrogenase [Alphaproteobacteria bacterium]|nr:NAD(P)-dependent glycerol-3-phosphate dehydrogenase [Alphaproteobacteria bacterium]
MNNPTPRHFGIIGAGAFGTALAANLRRNGHRVTVWAHHTPLVDIINTRHENTRHLPGIALDAGIQATGIIGDLYGADCYLFACPAQHMRELARQLAPAGDVTAPVIIASKGIERGTGLLPHQTLQEVWPQSAIAILSGPSFAAEMARGLPTAITLAANQAVAQDLAPALATRTFRPYVTDDVTGAALGGALKNVIAIACGIVAGRKLGDNARAALITRGLSEMIRLGQKIGARADTLMGLSGMGDLVLTCSSPQSRNMSLGIALGEGQKLADILAARNSVTEGVHTAEAAQTLARKSGVDMPVVEAVCGILQGTLAIDEAINGLLARPLKSEQA